MADMGHRSDGIVLVRHWRDPDFLAPVELDPVVSGDDVDQPAPSVGSETGDSGGEEPTPVYQEQLTLTEVEEAICSAGWPDCGKALRVVNCECRSGTCPFTGHIGAFQISTDHIHRFAEHGWDYWTDGSDPYKNSVIALEIFLEQGWKPWPVCGYR